MNRKLRFVEDVKITDFQPAERPREKLREQGARALSDSELLAILLRTGVRGTNVIDTARLLLHRCDNSLVNLGRLSLENMCEVNGIGMDKAVTVSAAMELSRRLSDEITQNGRIKVSDSEIAYRLLSGCYSGDSREECWCVFLKRSKRVLGTLKVSDGGETLTEINIKKIVRKALDFKASGVILSHNHPSGNPLPSKADIKRTKQLREALDTFELSLVDHIIVSDSGYYSFSAEKWFKTDSISP